MSDLVRSAPAPLFDRLCAQDEGAGSALDARGLQASIGRELGRLLNTRCGLTLAQFADCTGTVLDYGVPDFTALSPRSGADMELLRSAVERAIALFEPRLMHTEVKLGGQGVHPERARIHIAGAVRMGLALRRIELDMDLNLRDGTSGVA